MDTRRSRWLVRVSLLAIVVVVGVLWTFLPHHYFLSLFAPIMWVYNVLKKAAEISGVYKFVREHLPGHVPELPHVG